MDQTSRMHVPRAKHDSNNYRRNSAPELQTSPIVILPISAFQMRSSFIMLHSTALVTPDAFAFSKTQPIEGMANRNVDKRKFVVSHSNLKISLDGSSLLKADSTEKSGPRESLTRKESVILRCQSQINFNTSTIFKRDPICKLTLRITSICCQSVIACCLFHISSHTYPISKTISEEELSAQMTVTGRQFIMSRRQTHISWDAPTILDAKSISPLGICIALIC
jgi:hypothetical protein